MCVNLCEPGCTVVCVFFCYSAHNLPILDCCVSILYVLSQ